ncbi:hypothetical protein J8J17_26170, partial [Mycobacterium tuberculosis]|nr:hypothetical protein [Mycobacterium tuberculosis]
IGRFVLVLISRFGYAARTLISLIGASGDVLRRPRLVLEQLRFIGNDSFIIIAVSGLFVGFVLGLQGQQDSRPDVEARDA